MTPTRLYQYFRKSAKNIFKTNTFVAILQLSVFQTLKQKETPWTLYPWGL